MVCPLDSLEESPDTSDLPNIAVVGKIKNALELPNGNMRLLITGLYRAKVLEYVNYSNEKDVLDSIITSADAIDSEIEQIAYARKLRSELESYIDKNPFISNAILSELREDISLDKLTPSPLPLTLVVKNISLTLLIVSSFIPQPSSTISI